MVEEQTKLGFADGRGISDDKVKLFSMGDIDDMLLEVLKDRYLEYRDEFPLDIATIESLNKFYHYFRTFRKIYDTRATNK